MPPWYVEKEHRHPADSTTTRPAATTRIATIAKWADTGARAGNPADMPPPKVYADRNAWAIGTPDLVIKTQELTVKATRPTGGARFPSVPTGLTEDRYVAALEIKEVNDVDRKRPNRATSADASCSIT
jgi:hypothetical protein